MPQQLQPSEQFPSSGHSAVTRRRFVALSALTAAAVTAGLPGAAFADGRLSGAAGFDPAGFADPRRDSRPAVYWYWNGPVTHELVERQMADLRDKGMYEVVVFPYDNADMQPAFFTEGWFDVVGHVIETADKTGMKVWLFNDNHFPSGRAATSSPRAARLVHAPTSRAPTCV